MYFFQKIRVVFIFTDVSALKTYSLSSCSFNKYLLSTCCELAIVLGPVGVIKNEIG